jgi:hypothetical protein
MMASCRYDAETALKIGRKQVRLSVSLSRAARVAQRTDETTSYLPY